MRYGTFRPDLSIVETMMRQQRLECRDGGTETLGQRGARGCRRAACHLCRVARGRVTRKHRRGRTSGGVEPGELHGRAREGRARDRVRARRADEGARAAGEDAGRDEAHRHREQDGRPDGEVGQGPVGRDRRESPPGRINIH